MLSFAIMSKYSSMEYWPCYIIAVILSVIWNFTLNRKFTFQSSNNIPKAMFQVFLFYVFFIPFSAWFGQYLNDIGWNKYLVTGINMVLNFILEFLYQRYYVFKDSIDTKPIKI